MTPTIHTYVMNHYSRSPQSVVDLIRAQGFEPTVSTDRTDGYKDCHDPKRWRGNYDNFRAIMKMGMDQTEDWVVLFHDDVEIPPGFFDRVKHVLPFARPFMLSFYNPSNGTYREATSLGHHVVETYMSFWTQCFVFHRSCISRIYDWGTRHVEPGILSEDRYILRYCSRIQRTVQVVVPSFIQHEGYARSTFGIGAKVGKNERRSGTFDPDFDVTAVDWVKEFKFPYFDRKKTKGTDYGDGLIGV